MRKSPTKPSLTTPPNPLRYRKLPLFFGGLTVLVFSGYSAYLFISLQRAITDGANIDVPADVSNRYDVIAPSFDASVDRTERLIGLTRLRKKMVQEASGDVCEVSIGTGRNLKFYDWDFKGMNGVGKVGNDYNIKRGKVRSFTAVDKSGEMLEIAHEKFSKEYPGRSGVQWVIQDASEPLPPPPGSEGEKVGNTGKKYDTIVQTMGLCSTNDPVKLLKNLGESVEDSGRILLLEHGRGTWNWLNYVLDGLAPRHALEFGCLWNKDIGQIVKESGLEVLKIERTHLGTTWWVELRPRRKDSIEMEVPQWSGQDDDDKSQEKTQWWWSS
jgi:methyltransferase OMS1, mitochondrial